MASRFPMAATAEWMTVNLDDTICYCFHISKRKIVNFIRITRPRRASQVSECGGAGSGCGWCVSYLKRCFADAGESDLEGAAVEDLTAEQYARQRGDYIQAGGGTPPPGAIPPPANSS